MPESIKTKLTRWGFNIYPAYRGTGAWITYIAHDWREIRVRLPLSWQTRNYVGTIFGGSMYAAVDPMYMLMLIKNLGPKYIVWDKAASIQFIKPGENTLYAKFLLAKQEIKDIKTELGLKSSIERRYRVDLKDSVGELRASVEKTLYISTNTSAGD